VIEPAVQVAEFDGAAPWLAAALAPALGAIDSALEAAADGAATDGAATDAAADGAVEPPLLLEHAPTSSAAVKASTPRRFGLDSIDVPPRCRALTARSDAWARRRGDVFTVAAGGERPIGALLPLR
jgi:hypothetical protein